MAHWTRSSILTELRRLDQAGKRACYAMLMRHQPRLYFAARYHFGSFKEAVRLAHLSESTHRLRPSWTRQQVIRLIKRARRADEALNWQAVMDRNDELTRAAFASLQKRLFGSWELALNAAGVDADEVRAYQAWTPDYVLFCLREREAEGESLKPADVRRDDPSLHAAAARYFKSFGRALETLRRRRSRQARGPW